MTAPDGTAPDGTAPDGTAPDGTAPDGTATRGFAILRGGVADASFGMTDERSRKVTADLLKAAAPG